MHKEITPLTDSEIPLFLKAIKGHPFEGAYALCLFAGLREGECLGLSWDQVNFEARRITISQQLQHEKKRSAQYYIAPSTKSGKPRQIEPPEITFQYLRAERKRQTENRLAAGPLWSNPDNLVFTDELGGILPYPRFTKRSSGSFPVSAGRTPAPTICGTPPPPWPLPPGRTLRVFKTCWATPRPHSR